MNNEREKRLIKGGLKVDADVVACLCLEDKEKTRKG